MINFFKRRKQKQELAERQAEIEERKLKMQARILRMMREDQDAATQPPAPLLPPKLPHGVKQMAMDSACQSIYDYASIGDPSFYSAFIGYPALASMSQSSDYRSVAETTATEMTREWGEFKGDEEKVNALNDAFNKHKIRDLMRRAFEVESTMGRAQIYIDLDGAQDDLPFVESPAGVRKGSLRGFALIEPMWSTPSAYNANDPTRSDFYVPTKWYVLGREVHADRLITLIMRPVPDMLKPAYNFGGISMLQLMKPYVERYQRTADSISQLVHSFSLSILATDMAGILTGGDSDASLFIRAGMFNKFRDNSGLMMLDKEVEELSQINTPLTGLPELLTKAQESMAAPSHTPLVKLLGITPSGLNANSDGEIRVYYDYIAAQQNAHMRPIIERIANIIQLDIFGEIDPDIRWEFNPLYQLDDKEKAEVQETNSRTARNLVEGGIVSPEEVRETLAADDESPFSNIDVSDVPEPTDYYMGEPLGDYEA